MSRPTEPKSNAPHKTTGLLPPLSSAVTPGSEPGAVQHQAPPPRLRASPEDAPTLDFRTGLAPADASVSKNLGTQPGAAPGDPATATLGADGGADDIRTDPWSLSGDRAGEPKVEDGDLVGGRYRILGVLGKGGMAWTYRVRHEALGKELALKALREGADADTRFRDFFHQEAQLAGQLDHPNIVRITDFGTDEQYGAYLVMEQLAGETLQRRLDSGQPLRLHQALDFTVQLAEALHYMHGRGVIHRDVKPDNVFLCQASQELRRRPQLKLIDFGLARREALGALLSRTELLGTPAYMAPEQLHRAPPQPSMDVYALGSLLYEMLTGRPPYTGSVEAIIEAKKSLDPLPPSERGMERSSERLDALLLRALSREPATRHPTMGHFLFELRTVRDMLDVSQTGPAQSSTDQTLAASSAVQQGWMAYDNAPFPQFSLHADGRLLTVNQAFSQFVGVPSAGLLGRAVTETRLGTVFPTLREDLAQAVKNAEPLQQRLQLKLKDNSTSRLSLWLMPLFDRSGRFTSCTGIVIPESEQTEVAAR